MSLYLFNQSNSPSLSMTLYDETQKIHKNYPDSKWIFYAMTCYFNPNKAKELTQQIQDELKENLLGVHILIDREEWIKKFINIDMFVEDICEQTKLPKNKISLTPIKASNLFHAKSYAIISEEKINDIHQGFAIITSGNFTNSGFSKNLEIGQVTTPKDSPDFLEKFIKIFEEAKINHGITNLSEDKELLFASKLLSLGVFYHQWEQSHKIDLRFRLNLSDEEIKKREEQLSEERYLGLRVENSSSLSDDPINVNSFFEDLPKPIPDHFWGSFGIETLLGKWVPKTISDLIEEELSFFVGIYTKELKKFLEENMQIYLTGLEEKIKKLREAKIIKTLTEDEVQEKISDWKKKIKKVSENPNFIKLIIWKYEKINISMVDCDISLITSIAERIQIFYPKPQDKENLDKGKKRLASQPRVGKVIAELNWDSLGTVESKLFKEKTDSAKETLKENKLLDLGKIKIEANSSDAKKHTNSLENTLDQTTKENLKEPQFFVAILNDGRIIKGEFVFWDQRQRTIVYKKLNLNEESSIKEGDIKTFKLKKISK